MTNMIERMATAIVLDLWAKGYLMDEMDIPDDQDQPSERDISRVITPFKLTARAVLEAIRESTKEMNDEGAYLLAQYRTMPIAEVWQAMIDVTLENRK